MRRKTVQGLSFVAGLWSALGNPFRLHGALDSMIDLLTPSESWSGGMGDKES